MIEVKFGLENSFLERNKKTIVFLFFAVFFIIGLSVYKDYGMSWDEYAQWHDNGLANYEYIFYTDGSRLLNGFDKYHGPAFEILLIGIEKLFKLSDSRDIFLMRHLVTFIACFVGSIFFYQIVKKIFNSWKLGLTGFMLYALNPHLYAHSFYNSKDAVFLAFFTTSIFLLLLFHEKPSILRGILFALITALTIDIRIVGIIIPAISGFLFLIEIRWSILKRLKEWKKAGLIIMYFVLLIPLVILFWPILWMDPVYHFIEALKENSTYPWLGDVLYFGKYYEASNLPWHYLLFWIFISKPVFYSILFIIGTSTLLISFVKRPVFFMSNMRYELISLIWFFLPLFTLFLLKSTVFDTGRHVYFMQGGFILIGLFGLQKILLVFEHRKKMYYFICSLLFFLISSLIFNLIKIHPYQNVYFNCFAGNDMSKIKRNFEFDYWGVASKDVLQNILVADSSKQIKIYAENLPEKMNARMLLPEQRSRLIFTDSVEEANYFVSNLRWHISEAEIKYKKEIYSAKVGNASLVSSFRVIKPDRLYNQTKGKSIATFFTDFEKMQPMWANNNNLKPSCGAHSGLYATNVDSVVEYGSGLTLSNLGFIFNKKNVVVKVSFWRYVDQVPANAKFVISIVKQDGKPYFWEAINETKVEKIAEKNWEYIFGAIDLPLINEENCELSIYLWNIGKKRIFIDDISVEFIEEK